MLQCKTFLITTLLLFSSVMIFPTETTADTDTIQILKVEHTPNDPNINDNITIIATVKCENYTIVKTILLKYRVNGDQFKNKEMLKDYSFHYNTTIGPFKANTLVEYFIIVKDIFGNEIIGNNNGSNFYFVVTKITDNIPPTIEDVKYSPEKPTKGLPIQIKASIYDENGVYSANIFYRLDFDKWEEKELKLLEENIFSVIIETTNATFLHFYLIAVDDSPLHNEAVADNGSYFEIKLEQKKDETNPIIENISFYPQNPLPGEIILIYASVFDDSGINSVFLVYFYNFQWNEKKMIFLNETNYCAKIGPFVEGDVINFYIKAVDNSKEKNVAIDNNNDNFFKIVISTLPKVEETHFSHFILIYFAITCLIFIKKMKLKHKK